MGTGAYQVRASIRCDLHDFDGAIADYTEVLRLASLVTGKEDSFPDAYVWRGRAYVEKGDFPTAILDYEAALKLAPPDWHARHQAEEDLKQLRLKH